MHTPTLLSTLTAAAGLFTLGLCKPAPAAAAQPQITPGPILSPRTVAARQFPPPHSDGDNNSIDGDRFSISPSRISKSLACQSKYVSLAEARQPHTISNRALASWLTSAARDVVGTLTAPSQVGSQLTSLCDATITITPPAALQSAYSEYLAQGSSWASSAASQAHSIASECGGGVSAMVEWLIVTDGKSCTSAVLGLVNAWKAEKAGTTTTGSSSSVSTPTPAMNTTSSQPAETSRGQSGSGNGAVSTSSSSTGGVAAPRETGFAAAAAAAAAVAVGVAGVMVAL